MRSFITILVLCHFFTSCVEKIIMDPKERTFHVECILENSETQTIYLNYTASVTETAQMPVNEADITIIEHYKGQEGYYKNNEYSFKKVRDGVWSANFNPTPQARYNLSILVPGENPIKATTYYVEDTTMFRWRDPDIEDVFDESADQNDICCGGHDHLYTTVLNTPSYTFSDRAKGDFPLFNFTSHRDFNFWVYGMDYDPVKGKYVQADLITIPYPDSIRTLSMVDPYYDWIDRFNILPVHRDEVEEFKRPNNVEVDFPQVLEYGYPQYLHGEYNASSTEMHYRYLRLKCSYNHPLYDKGLEKGDIVDGFFQCEFCWRMYIAANFKPYKYGIPHPKAHLVFQIANDDYDKYLRTLVSYSLKKEYGLDTDLTDIWMDKNLIYSNIDNGTGIFGARYTRKVPYMDYESITYRGTTYHKKYTLE